MVLAVVNQLLQTLNIWHLSCCFTFFLGFPPYCRECRHYITILKGSVCSELVRAVFVSLGSYRKLNISCWASVILTLLGVLLICKTNKGKGFGYLQQTCLLIVVN